MRPSLASSFSTISRSITWKVSTVISRSWAFRISTKRDMCVPLNWCGSPTYMLNVAMVCCTLPERSLIWIGWRIALMPTLSIASLRESRLPWTSGISFRSRAFMGSFYVRNGLLDALGIQPHRSKQPSRVAVIDEAVGQAEQQDLRLPLQNLADRRARAAHDLVLLDRNKQFMVFRKLLDQLRIQGLYEAHIDHGGVEGLAGLERWLQHRAESEDRDALPGPYDHCF